MDKAKPRKRKTLTPSLVGLLNNLLVVPNYWAEKVMNAHPDWGVVSILDSRVPEGDRAHSGPRITVRFDDVAADSARIRRAYRTASSSDIAELLEFTEFIRRDPPPGLLVHSAAGIGRSPAVALGLVRGLLGRDHEIPALRHMQAAVERGISRGFRHHRQVTPNVRVTGLFDHALECEGRLVDTVIQAYYRHSATTAESVLRSTATGEST